MREKEAEALNVTRHGTELECVVQLRAEAVAWQAKALADQSTVGCIGFRSPAKGQVQCFAGPGNCLVYVGVVQDCISTFDLLDCSAARARDKAAEDDDNNAGPVDNAESRFFDLDSVEEVT
uniref:Uncharacterized protein n=1 Tax=Oryza sativa subsp. japonica TaxID=39947 RepID=Q6YYD8_ORYSJ|nr:hypothetical protein [Oryza sativa Japonica Group]BAD16290.1 hypothetical protein [Oryza sativa Japonica Group]